VGAPVGLLAGDSAWFTIFSSSEVSIGAGRRTHKLSGVPPPWFESGRPEPARPLERRVRGAVNMEGSGLWRPA
jgi:hypothetical protein